MPSQGSGSRKKKDKKEIGIDEVAAVTIGAGLGYLALKIFSPAEIAERKSKIVDGVKNKVDTAINKLFP